MTLHGRVEGLLPDGRLNITRLWRTRAHTPRDRPYGSLDMWAFEREEEAPHWYRYPGECELYDFSQGPLYTARGERVDGSG